MYPSIILPRAARIPLATPAWGLKSIENRLKSLLDVFEPFLGRPWFVLSSLLVLLAAACLAKVPPEAKKKSPRSILGPSWRHFFSIWGSNLGPFWDLFLVQKIDTVRRANLGPSWDQLGPIWGPFLVIFRSFVGSFFGLKNK